MQGLQKWTKLLVKIVICNFLNTVGSLFGLFIRPNRAKIPTIDDEILLKSAVKLSDEIKSGKLTSEKVIEAYIKRIKQVNPIINAVVDENYDQALKRARKLDERLRNARDGSSNEDKHLLEGQLVGVPVTVKETIQLEGSSYTAGLPSRASKRADRTSPSVEQLIDAGLIPIGSTNTPCMNLWWDSYNLVYGRSNNPHDLSRITGGSSGGEAAILAAAGSVVGVGSDLAGSIRIPACFCGVFGHKPTPLTVSNDGCYPVFKEKQNLMRGVGPMTRYAVDLAPMLKLMIKPEYLERLRLDEPVDLSKIKIYFCEDINDPLVVKCDQDVITGLRAAVQHFESTYQVKSEKVELEEFRYGLPLWSAEFEGGRIYTPDHPNGFVPYDPFVEIFKCLIGTSEFPLNAIVSGFLEKLGSKEGTGKHKYLTNKAEQLRHRFNKLLGDDGVLIMASHPQPATHHQTSIFKFLNCTYTAVGNVLHAPITQCPVGMSREGLPIGIQIISRSFNDRLSLAVAVELEKLFGGWIPPAKVNLF